MRSYLAESSTSRPAAGPPRGRRRTAPENETLPARVYARKAGEGSGGERRHRAGKAAPPPWGSGPGQPLRARRRPPPPRAAWNRRVPRPRCGRTALPAAWPPREDGESGRGTGSRPAASEHGGSRRPRPLAHPAGPAQPRHEAAAPPCPPLRIAGKEVSASARRLLLLVRNPGSPPPTARAGRHPHRRAGRLWGRECKQMGFYSYLTRVPCASPSSLGTKPPRRLLLLLQLLPLPPLRYSPTAATPTPGALATLAPTHRADRVPAARPAQCGAISSPSPAPRFPLPYSTASYENGVALPFPSLGRLALITQASGAGRWRGAQLRGRSLTERWLRASLCRSLREELAGRYRLSQSYG